jgi:hypothetical protein
VWWLTLIILAILEGQEDRGLRPAWTKGSQDPTSTSNWNDRHASPPCHPSYMGSINRRIPIQARLGIHGKPSLKKN